MMRAAAQRGMALLEVMIAMGVLAVSGLGVAAAQLSVARGAQQAAWRAHAWLAADSYAEMARGRVAEGMHDAPAAWLEARGGFADVRPGVRIVTLWRVRGAADACDGGARDCVALAFAPGGAER